MERFILVKLNSFKKKCEKKINQESLYSIDNINVKEFTFKKAENKEKIMPEKLIVKKFETEKDYLSLINSPTKNKFKVNINLDKDNRINNIENNFSSNKKREKQINKIEKTILLKENETK